MAAFFVPLDELSDRQTRITGWRGRLADDREIWKRISQGDADSFDAFYRENAPRLQVFLRHLSGNPQAAEDIAQETFTQIWNRPNGFQSERGSLRAYLYGIARKRAADWWRKQGPSDPAREDQMSVCQTETVSIVGDAFRRLAEEQRVLLWLREVEGQSYAELALILEVPLGTVKTLPHLGLQLTESVRAKSPVRLARKQMFMGAKIRGICMPSRTSKVRTNRTTWPWNERNPSVGVQNRVSSVFRNSEIFLALTSPLI
jgi:RNA polymerase sigma-70 factor (ECF subfamily)